MCADTNLHFYKFTGTAMRLKNNISRFIFLQFFLYAYMGAFTPYMIAMGLDRGFSQTLVSVAVSFQMMCVLLGNVFWGRVSDRLRTSRKTFMVTMVLCGLFQVLLYYSKGSLFFLVYVLFGLVSGAVGVLLDTWLLRTISYDIALFRKVRSAGAIGYAVTIAGSGRAVETYGYGSALLLSSLMVLVTLVLCLGLGEAEPSGSAGAGRSAEKGSFLKEPVYLIWLVLLMLTGLATSPVGNMKIVILNRIGAGAAELGTDGLIGCIAQFAMFFLVSKLEKYSPVKRMLVISVCVMTGLTMYIYAEKVFMIYAAGMLFYGIFSIINPCTREIVKNVVSEKDQATATGIADAVSNNVSTMVAMLYAGTVSDLYGIKCLLAICMVFEIVTVLICIGLILYPAFSSAGSGSWKRRRTRI